MSLTIDETRQVAVLANLTFSEDELAVFAEKLNSITAYIAELEEVDTAGTEMTAQVTGLQNVWREDVSQPSLTQKQALSSAEKTKDGFFKAKYVFD